MVENADLLLKTTKIILSYKRSPWIKQTWNYKNESLQCWNQQYIPACTLDFECSNTRSLFSGYAVINWPELFFQLEALSTYGTFPIRRFLSVAHFFFAHIKTSVVKPSGTYITCNLLKSKKHQIKNVFLLILSIPFYNVTCCVPIVGLALMFLSRTGSSVLSCRLNAQQSRT